MIRFSWLGCFLLPCLLFVFPDEAEARAAQQSAHYAGPIIDMHLHALPVTLGADGKQVPIYCYPAPSECVTTTVASEDDVLRMTLAAMNKYNIVQGFLSGSLDRVAKWKAAAPGRFIASPLITQPGEPSADTLRPEYAAGHLSGMGELGAQYNGFPPNAPALAPYSRSPKNWTSLRIFTRWGSERVCRAFALPQAIRSYWKTCWCVTRSYDYL